MVDPSPRTKKTPTNGVFVSGREGLLSLRDPLEETSDLKTKKTPTNGVFVSGREDLNLRPLAPHASALAGLRHAPKNKMNYSLIKAF